MGYPNWIERISDVLAEPIRTRANNATLNALLGVTDAAGRSINGNIGDFQARAVAPEVTLMDVLGIPDDANGSLYARLGAYTAAAPLKATVDSIEVDTKYINDVACPATPVAGSILDVLVEDIYERTLGAQNLNGLLGVADIAGRSITGNLGDFQANTNLTSLLAVIGGGWETANKNMYTLLYTDLLGHAVHGLAAIEAHITGATGIFHEQADVPVSIAVDNIGVDILDLNVASTRYIIRDMRLKLAADPGANTVTISLETLINDVATVVDTYDIDTDNWGTSHSLMDMFGVPHIAGDDIHIFATYSVAGPITLTGQYSHAKTNV